MTHQIPELEHYCGSWVFVSLETGEGVYETFERATAERVNIKKFKVVTAAEYLAGLNA